MSGRRHVPRPAVRITAASSLLAIAASQSRRSRRGTAESQSSPWRRRRGQALAEFCSRGAHRRFGGSSLSPAPAHAAPRAACLGVASTCDEFDTAFCADNGTRPADRPQFRREPGAPRESSRTSHAHFVTLPKQTGSAPGAVVCGQGALVFLTRPPGWSALCPSTKERVPFIGRQARLGVNLEGVAICLDFACACVVARLTQTNQIIDIKE